MTKFLFTRTSTNAKIGPMPAVIASRDTCPTTCGLRGMGCYAEHGHMRIHWDRVSAGLAKNLLDFEQLLHTIRALPRKIRWRYGTAGDLPASPDDVFRLAAANGDREAIVFTHRRDVETVREAGRLGMHINMSADSPADADTLPLDVSVVCVLPMGQRRPSRTPAGREIAVCPATYSDRVTCSTCNLCSRSRPRGVIIGFPAHGSRKRMVSERLTVG